MSEGHTETPQEAFFRLLQQAEKRQGAALWVQVRRHMELLCEEDPEVMLGLMTGALEPDVRRPCSWLWLRTKGGTVPEPRPSWDVAGTVQKDVITRVQGRDSTEARATAKANWRALGVEFSPRNHGTERVDE